MKCDSKLTVLVTGGASGLGAGTLAWLGSSGCKLACIDLPNQQAQSDLEQAGVIYVGCDITDEPALDNAISHIVSVLGTPHVVVNCAGIAPAARTVGRQGAHDAQLFHKVVAVNLTASYVVASRCAQLMVDNSPQEDNERGVIINTASVAAYDGQKGQCAYAASKAGIAGLTLPMARDLASFGIRVCAIAPGIFQTPMVGAMPEEVQQSLAQQIPFPKRLGQPDDYARLVQHIIENRMLNGEVIRLDGAIRMGSS